MRRRCTTLPVVVALLLAVSGCGTRVISAGETATVADAEGSSSSGLGGAADQSAATGGRQVQPGADEAADTSDAFGDDGAVGPAASSGRASRAAARAVTATTIHIGYPYSETAPLAAFSAVCAACASFGNQMYFPQLYDALAKDVNSRGGILGRKIAFHGYGYNSAAATSNSSQAAQFEQEACQHFTRDVPVFAVIFQSLTSTSLAPCLSRSRVSLIAAAGYESFVDRGDAARYLVYAPASAFNDTLDHVLVRRLRAMGYFSGWDINTGGPGPQPLRIGLVNFSDPGWTNNGPAMTKALSDFGYKVDPQDNVTYSAQLDTQGQSIQNTILKFRTRGVTHVMGNAANGLFMYEAVGQNYFPRYGWRSGFNSDQLPRSEQGLRGAMGVGFIPTANIGPARNPKSVGPMQARCERLVTKAGIDWQSNQDRHVTTLAICDSVWSLERALARSRTLSPGGLARGYDALGTVASTLTFRETWGADRRASASVVEDMRYEPSCSCFRYTRVRTAF